MSFEEISKQTTRITSTSIFQRPSSRWCSVNAHFETQVPFQANNALSGLKLYYFGIEYPFGPYPFGSRLPFWARTPFWAMNTLSGHKYPSRPQKLFQDEVVILGQRCPFGPRRPCRTRTSFWAKHALFGLRLPYQAKNDCSYREGPIGHDLSYCEFPIGPRMSFLIAKITSSHIRSCKQQSVTTGIACSLSLFPPCVLGLINQLKSVAKTVRHVFRHG